MSTSQQTNDASYVTAIKDQAVGAIKEVIGSVIGNTQMELEGKAQKVHGRNEYEYAKASQQGEAEPEKFQRAYHSEDSTELHETANKVESEPSQLSGLKDQALGAMKSTVGVATGNQEMELLGKAQNIHGRNEVEFAKAQSKGLSEPEHYAHGTKTTSQQQTKGEVEGQTVSSVEAMKDKAMGSMKETLGSMTGNQELELKGKAQNIHGRNEAEFAKAQKQGLAEPEHFAHGKKTTETAKGEVVSQEPSKLSGWKDQAVGAAKETLGSATNNQKMEIEGKAQKMHGSNLCAAADEKNPTNA